MPSQEIKEKAAILADAIAQSEELDDLRSKEFAMALDDAAQQLLAELGQVQDRLIEKKEKGEQTTEDDIKEIEDIEARMGENKSIAAYLKAQDKFKKMLEDVNGIIAAAIARGGIPDEDCGYIGPQ